MSTQVKAFESIVVSAPIESVWQFLRPFDEFAPVRRAVRVRENENLQDPD